MVQDKPYFMNDQSWYYLDKKEMKYKLTKDATEKAVKSYNEFYNNLKNKIEK